MQNFFDSYIASGSVFSRDLFSLHTGAYLGSGVARTVFEYGDDKSRVIKFETGDPSYQNPIEWELWRYVQKDSKLRKWFAPCYQISAYGAILIQARVRPLPKDKAPKKMPGFFCDFKYTNYGLYEGRVVCCDYGLPALVFKHGFNLQMKTAKWWE